MKPAPELLYQYRKLREKAMEQAERRKAAAFAACPRLKEISEQRRGLAYSSGLMRLKGDVQGAETALAAVEELNMEQARLLKSHGFEEDYMEPRFRCSRCGDTGYVGDVEKRLCPCIRQRMLEGERGGINGVELFGNFRTDVFPDNKQLNSALKALEACRDYAAAFPDQQPKDMLIMGGTGLGKSFLLNAIAAEVSAKGYQVWKTSAYNFINGVLEGIRSREGAPDFAGPDLVLIDDLGTEPMMPTITRESFFSLINERQSTGKATVWATNRGYGDIQDSYGDRFFSRLVAFRSTRVLLMEGKDLRMRIK